MRKFLYCTLLAALTIHGWADELQRRVYPRDQESILIDGRAARIYIDLYQDGNVAGYTVGIESDAKKGPEVTFAGSAGAEKNKNVPPVGFLGVSCNVKGERRLTVYQRSAGRWMLSGQGQDCDLVKNPDRIADDIRKEIGQLAGDNSR